MDPSKPGQRTQIKNLDLKSQNKSVDLKSLHPFMQICSFWILLSIADKSESQWGNDYQNKDENGQIDCDNDQECQKESEKLR